MEILTFAALQKQQELHTWEPDVPSSPALRALISLRTTSALLQTGIILHAFATSRSMVLCDLMTVGLPPESGLPAAPTPFQHCCSTCKWTNERLGAAFLLIVISLSEKELSHDGARMKQFSSPPIQTAAVFAEAEHLNRGKQRKKKRHQRGILKLWNILTWKKRQQRKSFILLNLHLSFYFIEFLSDNLVSNFRVQRLCPPIPSYFSNSHSGFHLSSSEKLNNWVQIDFRYALNSNHKFLCMLW